MSNQNINVEDLEDPLEHAYARCHRDLADDTVRSIMRTTDLSQLNEDTLVAALMKEADVCAQEKIKNHHQDRRLVKQQLQLLRDKPSKMCDAYYSVVKKADKMAYKMAKVPVDKGIVLPKGEKKEKVLRGGTGMLYKTIIRI